MHNAKGNSRHQPQAPLPRERLSPWADLVLAGVFLPLKREEYLFAMPNFSPLRQMPLPDACQTFQRDTVLDILPIKFSRAQQLVAKVDDVFLVCGHNG